MQNLQNFDLHREKAFNLIAHHVATLGGLQRPIPPAQIIHSTPTQNAHDGTGGLVSEPMTTRILSKIRNMPGSLFGR